MQEWLQNEKQKELMVKLKKNRSYNFIQLSDYQPKNVYQNY